MEQLTNAAVPPAIGPSTSVYQLPHEHLSHPPPATFSSRSSHHTEEDEVSNRSAPTPASVEVNTGEDSRHHPHLPQDIEPFSMSNSVGSLAQSVIEENERRDRKRTIKNQGPPMTEEERIR